MRGEAAGHAQEGVGEIASLRVWGGLWGGEVTRGGLALRLTGAGG
jgi:hypothetical protein